MKKLLMVLGVAAVAFAGLLIVAAKSASSVQKGFFQKVDAGDVAGLMNDMHPALIAEIDQPVMEVFVKAVNAKLGKVVSVTQSSFNSRADTNGTHVESTATVTFENGEATSKLETVDGKLTAFNLKSDPLGDWLAVPAETDLYEQNATTFMKLFLDNDAEAAWKMMHTNLQKNVSLEKLKEMAVAVSNADEPVEALTVTSTKVGDSEYTELYVNFEITRESGSTTGYVRWEFVGMKAHILGFEVK